MKSNTRLEYLLKKHLRRVSMLSQVSELSLDINSDAEHEYGREETEDIKDVCHMVDDAKNRIQGLYYTSKDELYHFLMNVSTAEKMEMFGVDYRLNGDEVSLAIDLFESNYRVRVQHLTDGTCLRLILRKYILESCA